MNVEPTAEINSAVGLEISGMLWGEKIMDPDLSEKLHNAVENNSIIIYGAHLVALELYRYLKSIYSEFHFIGFAVSAAYNNPARLENEYVAEFSAFKTMTDATILIAMPEKYHDEVERGVKASGFDNVIRIGMDEMTRLKKIQLLAKVNERKEIRFRLYEDMYDKSWLNLVDSAANKKYDPTERHYKFPVLYYMDWKELLHETDKFDFYKEYERIFGAYHNIHTLPVKNRTFGESAQAEKEINIYMIFSQWDNGNAVQKNFPSWIRPIQAGSILTEKKVGPFLDEAGTNISDMNGTFAEMTAAYWVWKNAKPVKYKGVCHYRRHFILTADEVLLLDINGIDVILTTPRYAPGGIGKMFLAETPVKEPVFKGMLNAVAQYYPEEEEAVRRYMEECLYCPNNMVIARNEIYDAYCDWIFPVLFKIQEIDAENGYGHSEDRHIAYAAELLTSYFFARHKDEYCIAMTDYEFYL